MSLGDHLQQLLTRLGNDLHGVDAVVQDGADEWVVLFSDGGAMGVHAAADIGMATFELPVGRPPPDGRLQAFEAALRFNARWRDNQGLRLSMVDAEQDLLLSIELPALLLDERSIVQLVEALRARAAGWTALLEGAAPEPTSLPEPGLPLFAFRV